MSDANASLLTGRCLCGDVMYRSNGPAINVRACHCRRCQRASGSAFYERVLVPLGSIEIDGPVAWHDGGTGIRRGFCPRCGSNLFAERASAGTIGLTIGTLDHPESFTPTDHIWVESKQPWVLLPDDLPHFQQGPPTT